MFFNLEKEFKENDICLINEDCLKVMKKIPDKSIDIIVCDLPYGQTKNKWDSVIPFEELWGEYNRIIKDNGPIILFGQGMFSSDLMQSNRKNYRYSLIWEKNNVTGFLNAKKMPLRSHEDILVFNKKIDVSDLIYMYGEEVIQSLFEELLYNNIDHEDILVFYKKLPTYNPEMWEGIPLHSKGKNFVNKEGTNNNYGKYDTKRESDRVGKTEKYPRSVLHFQKPHPARHPTEKPLTLIEYIIKMFSNEGDILLDNCMGIGTSIKAANNLNRKSIGIEIKEEYFNICKNDLIDSNSKFKVLNI